MWSAPSRGIVIRMKRTSTLFVLGCIAALAGCGGANSSPGTVVPDGARTGATASAYAQPDAAFRRGIYVSTESGVAGYRIRGNGPPCTVKGAAPGSGIAVDAAGNLMVLGGGSRTVNVYDGLRMCGRLLGSIADPYGQPADASSANATTSTIVVGNIFDVSGPGSISLCTLAGGCTKNLTNANMYEVAGVAMSNAGDCWASAANASGVATLTYFKKCSGAGQAATGFQNANYGGLDIDRDGNLVSISAFVGEVYVYKGCRPKCTLVGGPLALVYGNAVFGHLDSHSTHFAVADYALGQVDVYRYSPTSLTYDFSFGGGSSSAVTGVAYHPRSKQ